MIKIEEKQKLEKIFRDISENGYLNGSKAKELMLQTSIPVDILAKIWDMSDIDKDGSLNQNEFIISMYLINKAKAGNMPEFLPNEFYHSLGFLNYSQQLNLASNNIASHNGSAFSQIGLTDNYINESPEHIFALLDTNKDNLVDGMDCKNVFLTTKLPQLFLAQIWNICDVNQSGSLDLDHFKLAWYLINQKLKNGLDPPSQFYPELLELSKNSGVVNDTLTEEDYKEIPGGLQILNLMKEIAEIENEKAEVEKMIEQRTAELRGKNEAYQRLKHEVEVVLESVKILESGKERAQHNLDESVLEEKRQKATLEDVKGECAKIESEIAQLAKGSDKINGSNMTRSKSIENLLREESLLKQQLAASEIKLQGPGGYKLPHLKEPKYSSSQEKYSFDEKPVTFNASFDDAFGFTTPVNNQQDTFGTTTEQAPKSQFGHDPFANNAKNKHDDFFANHNNRSEKVDVFATGFDEDPFAPKDQQKQQGGFETFAEFDAFK